MATTLQSNRASCLTGLRALREAIEKFEATVDRITEDMPIGYAARAVPEVLCGLDILTGDGLVEIKDAINDLGHSS